MNLQRTSPAASLRILVVAPQPFYAERGTPIAVRVLAEALCDDGHRIDVLTYHVGSDISYTGLTLHRSPAVPGIREVPIGISVQKLICDVGLSVRLAQLLWRGSYDIVHAVEESVFPAVLFNRFAKRRLVYDMDSLMSEQVAAKWKLLRPFTRLLGAVERAAIRRCDCVLAVCEELADKVRPHVAHHKVTVLPDVPMPPGANGQVEALHEYLDDDDLLLLYVGNLEHYQGVGLLLESLARLAPGTRCKLIIIGGLANHIEQHRRHADELGVGRKVVLLGPRPVGMLHHLLLQADVLVSPRVLGGNTPMKIYSYMQAGRAILATRIRSHTQVLNEECCMLADPEPAAMARCLERLISDAGLRQRLGAAASQRVEAEFSLAAFRERLRSAYAALGAVRP